MLLLAVTIIFTTPLDISAQSALEALRYSSVYQIGTARNVAVGGVMGSLGADFSVLSTNPAGLGRYKSTEFGITPNIVFGNTSGQFSGNSLEDDYVQFNLSSGGIAFAHPMNRTDGWKGITGGVGINRLADYNDNIFLSGVNDNNSLLDMHSFLAHGYNPEQLPDLYPFDAGLSYLGDLIIPDSVNNYTSVFGNNSPDQDIIIKRRGGKYEAVIGAGGNFSDKIYIGGSIGIPIIRFEETKIISEKDGDNVVDNFNFFDFEERLRTNGTGVNFKAGVLAKPHQLVRVGAAFHTPTYMRMNDDYLNFLLSDFDTLYYEIESPDAEFSYNLILPWKFIANVGVLMDKYGFIGVEYELQDPGKASFKFKSNDPDVKAEETIRNDQIASSFEWQHSVRTGIEVKLDPIRLRAGFQYKTSGIVGDDNSQMIYSGGIGFRAKHFFIDGTYSYSTNMSQYVPYEVGNISSGEATLDHTRSQVMFTIGAKL